MSASSSSSSHFIAQPSFQSILRKDLPPKSETVKLTYDIHSYSSHSANYHPKNILVNKPTDQSSRWSSGSNNQLQYLTLKLTKPALLTSIIFGKYHKVHVCNLKEFKVFIGLTPTSMKEVLHSGLRNDSEAERFNINARSGPEGVLMPWCELQFQYLVCGIAGFSQPEIIDRVYLNYMNYRESQVVKLCLKYFRQRNYQSAFASLQHTTQLNLEDSMLTELHDCLVNRGDFGAIEVMMNKAAEMNFFHEYVSESTYKPVWKRIRQEIGETPCMRGGHQMCIDSEAGIIYLLGGWDGQKDLSDFWSFSRQTRSWACISPDTSASNGPSPRSCHKVCFDPKTKCMYVMGRYVDPDNRPNVNLDNDFWKYNTRTNEWTKISGNTFAEGGPELIYDHQMVIDPESQMLYIFGGRTIGPDPATTIYSGLYSYNITTKSWRLLLNDSTPSPPPTDPSDPIPSLKSRIGHSMLFNPTARQLYIFAGQRHKDYLSDFYIYDLGSSTLTELTRDYAKSGGPDAGFTQRATIDSSLNEIYILSGLQKEKNTTQESVKNSFWVYAIDKQTWTRVYYNDNTGAEYWASMKDNEPLPRFAHQLVYDTVEKVQYMFGGNPGDSGNLNARLDDFWQLRLLRPQPSDILRQSTFFIRRQQFREMCLFTHPNQKSPSATADALQFLQSKVSECVNHSDENESKAFRELTQLLFGWSGNKESVRGTIGRTKEGGGGMASANQPDMPSEIYSSRTELYETLLGFFPMEMREPKGNLVDLIDLI